MKGLPRNNKRISPFLYVGSSMKMGVRLRGHLGFCSEKTYALKLAHWYPPEGLPLNLVCASYPAETPQLSIEALEDTLWEWFSPMFGRKGAR